MTTINGERIPHSIESFCRCMVSGVNNPPVGLHKNSWAQVLVTVPPIRWACRRTASAEDTFVEAVQFCSIISGLKKLIITGAQFGFIFSLEPRLNGAILFVEIIHVRNQILDDVHVGQRINLGRFRSRRINFADTSQSVDTSNVHGAGATDSLSTRSAESQSWIHFVLDLNESIEDHGTAILQVHGIFFHFRFLSLLLRIPSINGESLHPLRS